MKKVIISGAVLLLPVKIGDGHRRVKKRKDRDRKTERNKRKRKKINFNSLFVITFRLLSSRMT